MSRVVVTVVVLSLAAQAAASPAAPAPAAADGRAPSLAPRLRLALAAGRGRLELEPERVRETTAPPCVADYCQPRVEVPGMEGVRRRASRTELFVALLDRADIEPVASIAWFFVVTGLRVDWTPAAMDESFGATAGGWGNLFIRLRMRIDPWNVPTVPVRPKERMRREREAAAERERAEQAERLRRLGAPLSTGGDVPGHLPARRRST